MHFDIAHSAGKARAQALQNRRQDRLERALRRRIREVLNRTFAIVADHARHGVFDVDHVVDSQRLVLQRVIGSYYVTIGQTFFSSVEEALVNRGGRKSDDSPRLETKGMAEEFWRAFHNWAFGDAFKEVKQINQVTKGILRRMIRRETDKGSSYSVIADTIVSATRNKKGVTSINHKRAVRIARTEVHRGSTYAVNEAVRSSRVKFEREWVSMKDDRTRPAFGEKPTRKAPWDHRAANGQRRGMDEPFDVSGEKLMYPGDTSLGASAGNVINCRCVVLYKPANPVGRWL